MAKQYLPNLGQTTLLFTFATACVWSQNFLPNPGMSPTWAPWTPVGAVTQAASWGPKLDTGSGITVSGRFFGQGNNVILFDALGVRDMTARTASVELKGSFLKGGFSSGPVYFPVPAKASPTAIALMGPPRNVAWVGNIASAGNGFGPFTIETQDDFGVVVRNVHSFLLLNNLPSSVPLGGAAGYMEEGVTRDAATIPPQFSTQTVTGALNDLSGGAGFSTTKVLVIGAYAKSAPTSLTFSMKSADIPKVNVQAYDFKAGAWENLTGTPTRFSPLTGLGIGPVFKTYSVSIPSGGAGAVRFLGPLGVVLIRVVPTQQLVMRGTVTAPGTMTMRGFRVVL